MTVGFLSCIFKGKLLFDHIRGGGGGSVGCGIDGGVRPGLPSVASLPGTLRAAQGARQVDESRRVVKATPSL